MFKIYLTILGIKTRFQSIFYEQFVFIFIIFKLNI
jgi:hypothetical protein